MNDRSIKRELSEAMRDIEEISKRAHVAANSLRVCARVFGELPTRRGAVGFVD